MRWILAFLLCALPVAAQNPRGIFNWWDTPMARDLNLTEAQRQQIRSTLRDYRGKIIDLRAAIEKAELEVEDSFNSENLDQQRANAAIERLAAARGDMIRVFSQMSLQMRTVLTQEQWRELQRRRPGMQPGGPAGPGGPGVGGPRRGQQRRGPGPAGGRPPELD
jgi:Spy/CpxP family protein refolding chaperone